MPDTWHSFPLFHEDKIYFMKENPSNSKRQFSSLNELYIDITKIDGFTTGSSQFGSIRRPKNPYYSEGYFAARRLLGDHPLVCAVVGKGVEAVLKLHEAVQSFREPESKTFEIWHDGIDGH